MRKVILSMNVSLDGYVATSNGSLDWAFANFDDDLIGSATEAMRRVDTMMVGRVNYLEQAAAWPNREGPLADILNDMTKVVFSKTLGQLEWQNSWLASGTPAEEIGRLKQQPGKDIFVAGGARFAQAMSKQGLIDEYRLVVHPAVLGKGMPLFVEPLKLKLVNSSLLKSGVIVLHYQPA
jgi:dihydrofolate reductase